jgi:hypothetical protein
MEDNRDGGQPGPVHPEKMAETGSSIPLTSIPESSAIASTSNSTTDTASEAIKIQLTERRVPPPRIQKNKNGDSPASDRTDEERVASRRKADFVAANLDLYPRYVTKWMQASWYTTIREDPNFYSFLNHKTLPKEFAEAYTAYKQVKHAVKKRCQTQNDSPLSCLLKSALVAPNNDILIIDMCSGKGFLSVLLNFKFPNANILMVDNMTKLNLEHIENLPRIDFWLSSITESKFIPQLKLRSKDYKAVVMIGIHLCGDLSEHFLAAFHALPNAACMVLSPCCISKKKTDLLEKAKREGISNYELWSSELLGMIQTTDKELKKLADCSSEKNNFLMATK